MNASFKDKGLVRNYFGGNKPDYFSIFVSILEKAHNHSNSDGIKKLAAALRSIYEPLIALIEGGFEIRGERGNPYFNIKHGEYLQSVMSKKNYNLDEIKNSTQLERDEFNQNMERIIKQYPPLDYPFSGR